MPTKLKSFKLKLFKFILFKLKSKKKRFWLPLLLKSLNLNKIEFNKSQTSDFKDSFKENKIKVKKIIK